MAEIAHEYQNAPAVFRSRAREMTDRYAKELSSEESVKREPDQPPMELD